MIPPTATIKRLCLVHHRVSFRNQHDGLLGEAYRLNLNPYNGDLVVFVGRHKKSIKVLFADLTGIWVGYKRFNEGVVSRDFQFLNNPAATVVAPSTVTKLIEGSKFLIGAS